MENNKEYFKQYHLDHQEEAIKRAREWYASNKRRAVVKMRAYRESHKEEIKAKKALYYTANREKIRVTQNARYDREKTMARTRAWRKANPEKYKILYTRGMNKRRALKLTTRVEKVDYGAVKARCGMWCGICESVIVGKFEYDHIIPLSRGGAHTTENHQLSHPSCNRKKSNSLGA